MGPKIWKDYRSLPFLYKKWTGQNHLIDVFVCTHRASIDCTVSCIAWCIAQSSTVWQIQTIGLDSIIHVILSWENQKKLSTLRTIKLHDHFAPQFPRDNAKARPHFWRWPAPQAFLCVYVWKNHNPFVSCLCVIMSVYSKLFVDPAAF